MKEKFIYLVVTYLINCSCLAGSFLAGLKRKMLYLYPGT
jgi:hypothetical protein